MSNDNDDDDDADNVGDDDDDDDPYGAHSADAHLSLVSGWVWASFPWDTSSTATNTLHSTCWDHSYTTSYTFIQNPPKTYVQ